MAIDKAVDSAVLDGYFSDIADAIRDKGGSGTYTPAQMAQAIEDIPAGENEELLALLAGQASGGVIVRGVTDLRGSRIMIGSISNSALRSLTFSDLLRIGIGVNSNAGGIIETSGSQLRELHLPVCTDLFLNNYQDSSYASTFQNLTVFDAPKLEYFAGRFPTYGLTAIRLPSLKRLGGPVFSRSYLAICDLGLSDTIPDTNGLASGTAFSYASALSALVLRYSTVPALPTGGSTFTGTPIASGTGYIYVPRALISTYESATNWSTYAGQFRAIEDYTSDGTVDGEFIMPT